MSWKSCDPCELGTVTLDWESRQFSWQGLGGHGTDMTPQKVVAWFKEVREEDNTNRTNFAVVWWHDAKQLCLYDADEFGDYVWDEEEEDTDE